MPAMTGDGMNAGILDPAAVMRIVSDLDNDEMALLAKVSERETWVLNDEDFIALSGRVFDAYVRRRRGRPDDDDMAALVRAMCYMDATNFLALTAAARDRDDLRSVLRRVADQRLRLEGERERIARENVMFRMRKFGSLRLLRDIRQSIIEGGVR